MLSIHMPLSSGAYFCLFSIWSWIPGFLSGIRGYRDTAIQVGVIFFLTGMVEGWGH